MGNCWRQIVRLRSISVFGTHPRFLPLVTTLPPLTGPENSSSKPQEFLLAKTPPILLCGKHYTNTKNTLNTTFQNCYSYSHTIIIWLCNLTCTCNNHKHRVTYKFKMSLSVRMLFTPHATLVAVKTPVEHITIYGTDPHQFPRFYGNWSDISESLRNSKTGT